MAKSTRIPEVSMPLSPPPHLIAYITGEEPRRATPVDTKCTAEQSLVEQLTTNYIIVKTIISNLGWQEQVLCASVCHLWHDAVRALQREKLRPWDFVMNQTHFMLREPTLQCKYDGRPRTEPLAVFVFANERGHTVDYKCLNISPTPCKPACGEAHTTLNVINHTLVYPKACMVAIKTCTVIYLPPPQAQTASLAVLKAVKQHKRLPFVAGLYLPKVPNVHYHALQYTGKQIGDFREEVDKITTHNYFKGILVFVPELFLLAEGENLKFIDYFKEKQPDVPFALGGCVVDSAQYDRFSSAFGEFENDAVSLVAFSVPKIPIEDAGPKINFDMYSLVIDSKAWTKPLIKKVISQFSKDVPRREYSAALKLSCIGRLHLHLTEQELFREEFPNTTLVGCYGNGEIGTNHPLQAKEPPTKRNRLEQEDFEDIYSYSTIFVYFTWGK